MFENRYYQTNSVNHGVSFFKSKSKGNGLIVIPTGGGKSVIIAQILNELDGNAIILQPSKEILEQNFKKYVSYGNYATVYSASAGEKKISKVVFATVGSVITKIPLFRGLKCIIIDECHLVNPDEGMYSDFIKAFPEAKVLGFTATPYRLEMTSMGPELRFITRTNPRIFNKLLYHVQTGELFEKNYLCKLEYYSFDVVKREMIKLNSTGTDFDERSLKNYYKSINMPLKIADYANRILQKKPNILIFTTTIYEANEAAKYIPNSVVLDSKTDKYNREKILSRFKKNQIKCLINVGVLTTGFDYPGLEAVLIARSTMSLSLYYQIVGRVMRQLKYPDGTYKTGWVIDLGGNVRFFGKIETMRIEVDEKGRYAVWNNGRQLTNVPFQK